jgi:hypothetical protein
LLNSYERRTGYTWIEFGRIADDGTPHYLTLGAGLSAAAARPGIDSWFFILEDAADGPRVGQDLWLTGPQRIVLTKERLREATLGRGQVFETADSYRRAVDERLFRLGTTRYAALMDTLIQLRQPQLSKKPDEASLSNALTEALPPLATDLLGDVADALNRLEEDRRQLEEFQALEQAIAAFHRRYHVYAATQSRRQARGLRQAQTEFDNASRALNEIQSRLRSARETEAAAEADHIQAARDLATGRARLDTLRADPAMQDANRLEQATRRRGSVMLKPPLPRRTPPAIACAARPRKPRNTLIARPVPNKVWPNGVQMRCSALHQSASTAVMPRICSPRWTTPGFWH